MRAAQLLFRNKLYFLVHLKGLLKGFGRTSYSQFGEDRVLESIFKGKKDGFFVDVGAYHPFHYSNTYLLYKRGWRGVNIEPNPAAHILFNLHRTRDTNINSGVASEVTEENYYIFNHQSCNTFSEIQKNKVLKRGFITLLGVSTVVCRPLNELLKGVSQKIDLLNIDVEGQNFEVLKSLDWSKHNPQVVCVEDDDFSFQEGSALHNYVVGKGYMLHSRVGLSSIYTRQS